MVPSSVVSAVRTKGNPLRLPGLISRPFAFLPSHSKFLPIRDFQLLFSQLFHLIKTRLHAFHYLAASNPPLISTVGFLFERLDYSVRYAHVSIILHTTPSPGRPPFCSHERIPDFHSVGRASAGWIRPSKHLRQQSFIFILLIYPSVLYRVARELLACVVYNKISVGGEIFALINDRLSADVYLTIIASLNSFHPVTSPSLDNHLVIAEASHELEILDIEELQGVGNGQ